MQFNIRLHTPSIDLSAIEMELQELDPAGLLDVDRDGTTLRVSTGLSGAELASVLGNAGYSIPLEQIEQVPSVCCGGCGG